MTIALTPFNGQESMHGPAIPFDSYLKSALAGPYGIVELLHPGGFFFYTAKCFLLRSSQQKFISMYDGISSRSSLLSISFPTGVNDWLEGTAN